jgi:hypothetical protein
MVTIPKLIDPLQIALAIRTAPPCEISTESAQRQCFSTRRATLSTVYQHNLLIRNDLQRPIIGRSEGDCCGMSHTEDYRFAGLFSLAGMPLTARRMRFIAFLLVESAT